MKESPFLNTEEAANYVRLDPRTLNNMRYRNAGPRYRKHGCKVFYHIDDLDYWSSIRDCGSGPKRDQSHGG